MRKDWEEGLLCGGTAILELYPQEAFLATSFDAYYHPLRRHMKVAIYRKPFYIEPPHLICSIVVVWWYNSFVC